MAYITGTAATANDILVAIRNACIANGWTLTNDILSKGTCFVRLWSPAAGYVSIISGRGQTGGAGSVLTGQSSVSARGVGNTFFGQGFTYPMTYHIHLFTGPDEVYVFLNYNSNYYGRIQFGQSNVAGLGAGATGNFFGATWQSQQATVGTGTDVPDNRVSDTLGSTNYAHFPFGVFPGFGEDGCDHGLNAAGDWSGVHMTWYSYPEIIYSPNTWNGSTALGPMQGYVGVAGFRALALEFQNLRFCCIENLEAEQILTLGTEKWKVYPAWRKGPRKSSAGTDFVNNGGVGSQPYSHSTTYGIAVRYDGP